MIFRHVPWNFVTKTGFVLSLVTCYNIEHSRCSRVLSVLESTIRDGLAAIW